MLSTGVKKFIGIDFSKDEDGNPSDDYDGDGLKNGEELIIQYDEITGHVTAFMLSDPTHGNIDGDAYNDAMERNLGTDPFVKDYQAGAGYNNFQFTEEKFFEKVADEALHTFDWEKTDENELELINYFYEYASDDALNASAKEREKLATKTAICNHITYISEVLDGINTVLDAGTSLALEDKKKLEEDKKKLETEKNTLMAQKVKFIKKINGDTSNYDAELSAVLGTLNAVWGLIDSISKVEGVDIAESTIKVLGSLSKTIDKFKKIDLDIKWLDDVAKKYKSVMDKDILGGAANVGDAVGVGLDIVSGVGNVVSTANTYSKIAANIAAFDEYTDILGYIGQNADEKFTRNAAKNVYKVVLTEGEDFCGQVGEAILKESAKVLISVGLTLLENGVPVIKVITTALKVIDALCGFTADSKSAVRSIAYEALYDASRHYLKQYYREYGNEVGTVYFTDTQEGEKYFVQTLQIIIAGEDVAKEWYNNISLSKWLSYWLADTKKSDIIDGISTNMRRAYN